LDERSKTAQRHRLCFAGSRRCAPSLLPSLLAGGGAAPAAELVDRSVAQSPASPMRIQLDFPRRLDSGHHRLSRRPAAVAVPRCRSARSLFLIPVFFPDRTLNLFPPAPAGHAPSLLSTRKSSLSSFKECLCLLIRESGDRREPRAVRRGQVPGGSGLDPCGAIASRMLSGPAVRELRPAMIRRRRSRRSRREKGVGLRGQEPGAQCGGELVGKKDRWWKENDKKIAKR